MNIILNSDPPQSYSYQHCHLNTTQYLNTNIKNVNIWWTFLPCSYSVYVLLVYQPQQPLYKLIYFPSFFFVHKTYPAYLPTPYSHQASNISSLQSSSSEIATSPTACTKLLICGMTLKILWFPVCLPSLPHFWGVITFTFVFILSGVLELNK